MENKDIPPYATVRQICELYPFLKEGGVRHLLFSNVSFRKKCAKKLGRKLVLDVASVLAFIKEQPSE